MAAVATFVTFFFMTTNLFAAQTQIAQVNGMMCVKCQKMVTKALQEAMPNAKVKVSWPEGVAVSSFAEKSPISEEEYKNTILGTGFEVVKVMTVNLNNIIDYNYYPTKETETSNLRHRPIGLGVQGLGAYGQR